MKLKFRIVIKRDGIEVPYNTLNSGDSYWLDRKSVV